MRLLFFVTASLHLSWGMWQPNSQNAQYSDIAGMSDSNTAQLRRRPALSQYSAEDRELSVVQSWPDPSVKLGQVSAVTVDDAGRVFVFHRGPHTWDGTTFDMQDNYMKKELGPVNVDTVVVLDPATGKVIKTWGKNLFYMPHGLTVDHENNLWVTDVALHQIFKYPPLASLNDSVNTPLLYKGERFVNGKDDDHLCKPSAVAVLRNGDFFVSDGYCNTRIIKFDKQGTRLMTWGRSSFTGLAHRPGPYQFLVPHALTLAEDRDLVCAADRENGRVQCFYSHNGTYVYEIYNPAVIGQRLFSLAYTPTKGGLFYIVNGPFQENFPVRGFIVDANNLNIVKSFQPAAKGFDNPHDVAVSPDGENVYVVELNPYRIWKFAYKGGDNTSNKQNSVSIINQSTSSATSLPAPLAILSNPSAKLSEGTNSTSALPVGLNLMANSFAKGMSTAMMAVASLMVVLFCVMGGGIVWYMRSRRRVYPPISKDGFKLGHLLSHSHRGFEQVSTEESDDDRAESDQPA